MVMGTNCLWRRPEAASFGPFLPDFFFPETAPALHFRLRTRQEKDTINFCCIITVKIFYLRKVHRLLQIISFIKDIAPVLLLILAGLRPPLVRAQAPYPRSWNLNTSTGLPSNHIYTTATDHLGYLWIATPKGVVRYNGYDYTVFDMSKGLPTDDNWFLTEDRAGRMWLCNASHELGYIRNNRYYAVVKNSPEPYYFTYMARYRDGFIAVNKGNEQSGTWQVVSYAEDTLHITHTTIPLILPLFMNEQELLISRDKIGNWFAARQTDSGLARFSLSRFFLDNASLRSNMQLMLFGSYCCFYRETHSSLTAVHTDSPRVLRLHCPEGILYTYAHGGLLYLLGTHSVYVYDSLLRLKEQHALPQLTNNQKQFDRNPFIYYNHPVWGLTLGTFDKGLYINTGRAPDFIPLEKQPLEGYHFIGSVSDTQGYWWNIAARQMMLYSAHSPPAVRKMKGIRDVQHLFRHRPDSALITANGDLYWLTPNGLEAMTYKGKGGIPSSFATIRHGTDTFFSLTRGSQYSLFRSTLHDSTQLTSTRCKNMVYDPFRKGLWLFRNQQFIFYDIKTGLFRNFDHTKVRSMGLRKIEQIAVDEAYGNIFIKDYDQLFWLNEEPGRAIPLFPSIRCSDAILLVQGKRLLLAGRFGLLSARIAGKGRLKDISVRPNKKDTYYQTVYDLQLLGEKAVINTDKGAYEVMLAPRAALQPLPGKHYRFILYANDSARIVQSGDTLVLHAGCASLLPDVINPGGTGRLELSCYDNTRKKTWTGSAGTAISLAGLRPETFHTFRLKASDQLWQSEELVLHLYLEPYWWQTSLFRYLLILLVLAAAGAVIFAVSRIAVRRQLRRQHMLEMGLTGVHAQINPHFIFNSLTTTQYFIKTNRIEDAYRHINRFSRLLRNFLQASRDQYISIREEVQHLENYIELQQARFTERFDYFITLAPDVDPELRIPSLLLQPLVENAIQHGLLNKKGKGNLKLSFVMEGRNLTIFIDDDGIGREQAKHIRSALKSVSYGTDLIRKLIYIYGKYEKLKIDLSYTDKTLPETGTLLRITIIYPPA